MTNIPLSRRLEALIIASDEPLTLARMRDLTGASSAALRETLGELVAHYRERGINLHEVAGGWQFRSAAECADIVQQLWQTRPPRLSRSMLETLAIIAYRQPVTRAEIEALRGVKVSSSIIGGLQERGWVKVLGRKEVPGRPHLFGTGKTFLVDFGLNSLSDLPEIEQLMDQEELEAAARIDEAANIDESDPASDAENETTANHADDNHEQTDRQTGPSGQTQAREGEGREIEAFPQAGNAPTDIEAD